MLLRRSLDLLFLHYNQREGDDVLIWHEGDFTAADQRSIASGRTPIRFVRLPTRYWSLPHRLATDNQSTWTQPRFSLGYRHMLRWYAICLWPALHEMGYSYVMRLDEESFILSPIRGNIFARMAAAGVEYGWRMVSYESGGSPVGNARSSEQDGRFHEFVRSYLSEHRIRPTFLLAACQTNDSMGSASAALTTSSTSDDFRIERCGEMQGFYNNWFVSKLSFWLSSPVQSFLRHVDESGLMYRLRWNDLIVQSAAVQIFLPRARARLFTDFTYEHATRARRHNHSRACVVFGGLAQGTEDPDGYERARRFLREFCSPPCWRTTPTPGTDTDRDTHLGMRLLGGKNVRPREVVSVMAGLTAVEQPDCTAWPLPGRCSSHVCRLRLGGAGRQREGARCAEIVRWVRRHPLRQNPRSRVRFACDVSVQDYLHRCRGECPAADGYQTAQGPNCAERLIADDQTLLQQRATQLARTSPWPASTDLSRPSGFTRKDSRRFGCEDLSAHLHGISRGTTRQIE